MSNISNRHTITRFVSGESKPLVTQRLAKCVYKSTTKNPAKFPSVCASLPRLTADDVMPHIPELLGHIGSMLENAQDGILRSLYESSVGLRKEITDEEISVTACIAYLSAENAGSRLSEESIGAWFDSDLSDNLTVVIADKLGFDLSTVEQESVVAKHVALHKSVLCVLAGKNVVLSPKQESGIKNMLKIAADTSSGIGAKVEARFVAVTSKKEELDMIDIG